MLQKTLTLFAATALVGLFACSSDSTDKFGSVDSFCASKADALCNNVAVGCGTTTDKCKPSAQSVCVTEGNSTGRAYRASAAQDCIDKTNEVYAKKNVTADDETALAAVCGKVFPGTKQKTESCAATTDCVDGLVCDAVDKKCATKTDIQLNDGCNNSGDTCVKGTYCQAQGARSYCVAKNAVGAICAADKPCLEDLRCASTGLCAPRAGIGEACAIDDDCVSTSIAPYCDTVSKTCKQLYTAGTSSCKAVGG